MIDIDNDFLIDSKIQSLLHEDRGGWDCTKIETDTTVTAFKAVIDKLFATFVRKNHDYGNAFSEIYNELGINYAYGKIREKANRIKVLKDKDPMVKNEPLEDALLDCANYCILAYIEYVKRNANRCDGKAR